MFLKIDYNLNKDIQNYQILSQVEYKGGVSKVLNLFSKKFFDDFSEENIKKFIKGFVDYNKIDINQKLIKIRGEWGAVEPIFTERINKIFGVNFPLENISAYLTTADRCTLGKNYFFVTVIGNRQKMIIMHELLHFYTFAVFKKELEVLSKKQVYDVKESMTELLNLEFFDLMEANEVGYPQHQELRIKVREFWLVDKNIKNTFNKLVDVI